MSYPRIVSLAAALSLCALALGACQKQPGSEAKTESPAAEKSKAEAAASGREAAPAEAPKPAADAAAAAREAAPAEAAKPAADAAAAAREAAPAEAAKPAADAAAAAREAAPTEAAKPAADAAKPAADAAEPAADAAAADLAPLLASARKYLPHDSFVLLALDLKAAAQLSLSLLPLGSIVSGDAQARLMADLTAFVTERVGFNPLAITGAVVAISLSGGAAVLLRGDVEPKATALFVPEQVDSVTVYNLQDPPITVLPLPGFGLALFDSGNQAAVFASGLSAKPAEPSADAPVESLVKTLLAQQGAWFALAVTVKGTPLIAQWDPGIGFPAPDAFSLHATGGKLMARLDGTPECVDGIMAQVEKLKGEAIAAIAAAKAQLAQSDLFTGMGIIVADNLASASFEAFMPRRDGSTLRLEVDIRDYGFFALTGIVAAIAVPSFIRYEHKAKTSEAIENLDKIYKGAAVYYSTPKVDEQGRKVPCQFPASIGATPAATCCGADGSRTCQPSADAWNNPTWAALSFQVVDSHYFTYSFDSNGKTGPEAQFTATAYGDLDCDGILSTFQRSGTGDPNASVAECGLGPSSALFIDNEEE